MDDTRANCVIPFNCIFHCQSGAYLGAGEIRVGCSGAPFNSAVCIVSGIEWRFAAFVPTKAAARSVQQYDRMTAFASFRFRRFDSALGAEIGGLDLSQPLGEETVAEVRQALLDSNALLVLRDQSITPAEHIAFSRRFGPLMIHVLHRYALPDHPEILRISNVIENGEPIGLGDAVEYWHSDLSYTPEPSLGSLLHALELPPEGGDTSFASMTAAYDALAADIKDRIETRYAVHSYTHRYDRLSGSAWRPPLSPQQRLEVPEVAHPMVRTHPETGRRCLFVSEGFCARVRDLREAEGRALLKFLYYHSTEPRLVYRHRWRDHDLLFWDNRCTIHMAHGCPPRFRRHMHRTTIKGDAPRLSRPDA
jgi:taurine dioxygenase